MLVLSISLQAVNVAVLLQRYDDRVSRQLSQNYADELSILVNAVNQSQTPDDARRRIEELSRVFGPTTVYSLAEGVTVTPGIDKQV